MEICIYASEPPVCVRGLVPAFSPGSHDNDLITGIMGFRGTGIIRLRKRPRAAIRRFTFACESLGHPPRLVPVYTFVPGETFCPATGSSSVRAAPEEHVEYRLRVVSRNADERQEGSHSRGTCRSNEVS